MVEAGWREADVWELPLNKFNIYVESVQRVNRANRAMFVVDTASAVAGALSGKGLKKYIAELLEEDDG